VLAFFDSKGLVYANFMTKGKTVNTVYIIEALTRFSRILKEKRSAMMARTGGSWACAHCLCGDQSDGDQWFQVI
jgi:hypothetical protein